MVKSITCSGSEIFAPLLHFHCLVLQLEGHPTEDCSKSSMFNFEILTIELPK